MTSLQISSRSISTKCRLSLVAAMALALGGSVHGAPPVWPPDTTIPNAFSVQLKSGFSENDLNLIKNLGFKCVRKGFYWQGGEKVKGVYDFTESDKWINEFKAHGFTTIVATLFGPNKLYGHPKDEPARTAYAKWAAAMADHYKNENVVWEIWNEPNTMTFWGKHGKKGNSEPYAEEYCNLVKATAPAMLKANPKAIIMGGSVSGLWTESYKWMDFCFNKGILKTGINVWSVHPYIGKCPEDYFPEYAKMRAQMARVGVTNFTVTNTERGFPIGKAEGFAGGDLAKSNEYQAWHVVRQYLVDMLCDVKMTNWYEWSGKEGFALYLNGKETPAYKATGVMMKELTGYRLDKRIGLPNDRDFVVRFVNPAGGVKLVAWCAQPLGQAPDKLEPHTVTVPVGPGQTLSLESTDIYGAKGTVPVKTGSVEIKLSGAPQYVTVKK